MESGAIRAMPEVEEDVFIDADDSILLAFFVMLSIGLSSLA